MTNPTTPLQPTDNNDFSSLEPHGERRRRQLVRAAAHIVELEGLDALRMPRVAELAGCTRTLVYRYFPSTDDLLIAVASEYYAALEERLDREAQRRTATGRRDSKRRDEDAFETSLKMLDVVFDVVTELGLAGLMLRGSPHLSDGMRTYLAQRSERFSAYWVGPIKRSGLSPLHASLVTEAGIALLVDLVRRWQRDEITREAAMTLSRTCFTALLRALQEAPYR
jgi:AcrR family transcriptional regulator